MARAKTYTVRQLGEEYLRRLDELHSEHGGNNLRVAALKAADALTYLARWEDPRNPERLDNGELTK